MFIKQSCSQFIFSHRLVFVVRSILAPDRVYAVWQRLCGPSGPLMYVIGVSESIHTTSGFVYFIAL